MNKFADKFIFLELFTKAFSDSIQTIQITAMPEHSRIWAILFNTPIDSSLTHIYHTPSSSLEGDFQGMAQH